MQTSGERKFILHPPASLLAAEQRAADGATQRLYGQAMYLYADKVGNAYADMLRQGVNAGADTRLTLDRYIDLAYEGKNLLLDEILSNTPLLNRLGRDARVARHEAVEDVHGLLFDLGIRGVDIRLTHPPRIHPPQSWIDRFMYFRNRRHEKGFVADDVAFLMGMNMAEPDYARPDLGIEIHDPSVVEPLAQYLKRINEGQYPKKDEEIICNDDTSLWIDSGREGKSLILDKSVQAIVAAKDWALLASMLRPDGPILSALDGLDSRGKSAEAVVSEPGKITDPMLKWPNKLAWWGLRGKGVRVMYHPKWIHSKLLLVDDLVITGSHNFSIKGVKMHTPELVLASRDPDLFQQAWDWYHKLRTETFDKNS